jgi:23S rRNA (uracil1939-C5)-methyltransferase
MAKNLEGAWRSNLLEDGGYKTLEVQPVDMFPHTTHCEAVAWLELV